MHIEMNPAQTIPEFSMDAPSLRQAVDQIADDAMTGLEKITQAFAVAPESLRPLLNELRALFCSIGFVADSSSNDVNVDLAEVWGLELAPAGSYERQAGTPAVTFSD